MLTSVLSEQNFGALKLAQWERHEKIRRYECGAYKKITVHICKCSVQMNRNGNISTYYITRIVIFMSLLVSKFSEGFLLFVCWTKEISRLIASLSRLLAGQMALIREEVGPLEGRRPVVPFKVVQAQQVFLMR